MENTTNESQNQKQGDSGATGVSNDSQHRKKKEKKQKKKDDFTFSPIFESEEECKTNPFVFVKDKEKAAAEKKKPTFEYYPEMVFAGTLFKKRPGALAGDENQQLGVI